MSYKLSAKSLKRLEGVHPLLIAITKRAIQLTKVDFGIPSNGGVRTAMQQNVLFEAGKSKCDGYNTLSNHQPKDDGYGYAVDFFAYVDGKGSWEIEHLAQIAAAFLQAAGEYQSELDGLGHRIVSGGLFISFEDWPHIEMVKK